MNRYILSDLTAAERATLLRRAQSDLGDVEPVAREIVAAVRRRGDEAVIEYTAKLDGANLTASQLMATDEEFDAAERLVPSEVRAAIAQATRNVMRHHEQQVPGPSWMAELSPGTITGERLTPIRSVGLYVPRGKGSFPSVMIMLGVPALLAKVPNVCVCTPPGPDGSVDAGTLVAARACGVTRVYKVGGAQAIAALAYGTASIPRVDKILGPGNKWVAAARRLVYGDVDPGAPAGPSESVILCDGTADPDVASRELLVEAEHGPDSAALLVTDSVALADAVTDRIPALLAGLPEQRRRYCEAVLTGFGGVVVAADMKMAVGFVNDYAPEHLRVLVKEPFEMLNSILHAGEVLLGEYSSISLGNFAVGVNAILPTGGSAHGYSCLGVEDFLKRSSFAYVSAEGARHLGPVATTLAEYEGFSAHAQAARFVQERAEAALLE